MQLLVIAAAPLLTSADPTLQDPMASFAPPSMQHPMGTDAFGRDLFARVLYGGRTTVLASLCVVMLGAMAGVTLGLIAGYAGGAVRFVIMRTVDLLLAFPGILLALAVSAVLGPGLVNGVFAIAIVLTPVYARLVEGATAEVRHLPDVDAVVTPGAGAPRIILRHILPNISPGFIVLTTTWQREFGLTYLFIAHDLAVVEYISDRVGVMYLGRLVEFVRAERLYDDARMPYTRALLSATPGSERSTGRKRIVLTGDVPSPLDPPPGCPFGTRCWLAEDICRREVPVLREIEPEHFAACHFAHDRARISTNPA